MTVLPTPGGYDATLLTGLNYDGTAASLICRTYFDHAFRWDAATPNALQELEVDRFGSLGPGCTQSWGISGDGQFVYGRTGPNPCQGYGGATRWNPNTTILVVAAPSDRTTTTSSSHNGAVLSINYELNATTAHRWEAGIGDLTLPVPSGAAFSAALGVSGDGSTIVGRVGGTSETDQQACRWIGTTVPELLGTLGGPFSTATATSSDGNTIVGQSGVSAGSQRHAFCWTPTGGMTDLRQPPTNLSQAATFSYPVAIRGDGEVVLGYYSRPGTSDYLYFLWTAETGMLDAVALLAQRGIDWTGWEHISFTSISTDGSALGGFGTFGGATRAFIIQGLNSQRIYVNRSLTTGLGDGSSWTNAFHGPRALNAAIDLSSVFAGQSEIWVAAGTYTPAPFNGSRTASFQLRSNLAIYGGFVGNETSLAQRSITANPTVLSGDLNADDGPGLNRGDNSLHVATTTGAGPSAILDGFVVTGGNNETDSGGGLFVSNAAPTVRNCTFVDNQAYDGGAVEVQNSPSSMNPVFDRCNFEGNSAQQAGGACNVQAAVFRSCRFLDNRVLGVNATLGGAVATSGEGGVFVDCEFLRNRAPAGGAVWGGELFVNCRFLGNTTTGKECFCGADGGALGTGGSVFGSLFVGNVGTHAGAISSNTGTFSEIVNCTFVQNIATDPAGAGGIEFFGDGQYSVSNSILWDNRSGGINGDASQSAQIRGDGAFVMRHNLVQGWNGTLGDATNNGLFPAFVNLPLPGSDGQWGTPDDQYVSPTLLSGSPAIDTGENGLVPPDELDIDRDGNTSEYVPIDLLGSPRILDDPTTPGNAVDRGCCEFLINCPSCPDDRVWIGQSGDWNTPSNWFFGTPSANHIARFGVYGDSANASLSAPGFARRLEVISGTTVLQTNGYKLTLGNGSGTSLLVSGSPIARAGLYIIGDTPGGFVEARVGRVAEAVGSSGRIELNGAGARLTLPLGALSVGVEGAGDLELRAGATCAAQFFNVGEFPVDLSTPPDGVPDRHGAIYINGKGSSLKPKFGLNITSGSVTVTEGSSIDCGTTGTIFILPGSILAGNGDVIGRVVNFGEMTPDFTAVLGAARGEVDHSFHTMRIDGDYLQIGQDPKTGSATGKLRLRIGRASGPEVGLERSDRVVVTGTASLAGGLFVVPGANFDDVTFNESLTLFEAGSVAADRSRFDVALLPGLSGKGTAIPYFRLSYHDTVRGTAAVVLDVDTLTPPSFNGPTGFTAPGAPTSAVTGDFNGDSKLDLAVTIPDTSNPTTAPGVVTVLLNGGTSGASWLGFTSQVTITVGKNPNGLAVGRFRGGAQPLDIAVANTSDNSVMRLTNSGGGLPSFGIGSTLSNVGSRPVSLASGDFNGDGSIDLAVANSGVVGLDAGGARVLPNSIGSSGTFTLGEVLGANQNPVWIAAGNLNGDALIDLVTADYGDNTITTMMSLAPGTGHNPTHYPTSPRPLQVTPGGLDNPKDLDNDLAAVCAGSTPGGPGTVDVLRNLAPGTGTFAPAVALPIGDEPRSLAIVDMDGDGDNDIAVVANADSPGATEVKILRNDKNGGEQLAFAPQAALDANNPVFVLSGDVDNNATNDLITVNAATGTLLGSASPGEEPSSGAARQESRGNPPPPISVLRNAAGLAQPPCPSDLNSDHEINTLDLIQLLQRFGQSVSPGTPADINQDGAVNTLDLILLLQKFGQPCP